VTHRDLVVVGASAGGVEALRDFVAGLPADLPAAVLVVLHMPTGGRSALATVLGRPSTLPVRAAVEGAALVPGTVTVAVPDRHLLLAEGNRVTLSLGPRENGHRPSVDALFRSAAQVAGPRVVGVVLSGALDDGAAGMVAVRRRGGVGIVQDFDDALYDSMPRAARAAGDVEHVVPVKEMSALIGALLRVKDRGGRPSPEPLLEMEAAMADLDAAAMHDRDRPGDPSGFGCPDCHGALFEITEGGLTRYRCRVGHAWSPHSLLAQQSIALEGALWMALRGLEEKASLIRDLGDRARDAGHDLSSTRFIDSAEETLQAAELVRRLIEQIGERYDHPDEVR